MKIVAIFDSYSPKVGMKINNLVVQPMEELEKTVHEHGIRIGIITVPDFEAQNVANQLIASGIEAILNFAPTILKAPAHIRIHTADFTTDLQSLAYYLDNGKEDAAHDNNEVDG